MKKFLLTIPVLFIAMTFIHAQGMGEDGGLAVTTDAAAVTPPSQLDTAVKTMAGEINKKLIAGKAGKITVGQFAYRGNIVPLGNYWVNQLIEELANIPNKPYTVLSLGMPGGDRLISGEIIDTPEGAVRFYTRLIRMEDQAVEASYHFDVARNEQIVALLSSGEGRSGRSSSVAPDAQEPDSFDAPVAYEIGVDENAQVVNRTLHSGDEDFFLLIPASDGQLISETTGSVDTYMELYNAETREKLAQNDDGGSGSNARIRYNAQAGKRYIAKVRGYDGSTGQYGFRSYLSVRASSSGFDNPLAYEIGADDNAAIMNRSIDSGDEDFFLLLPANDGQLIMETTGSIDTFMEFYNAETRQKLAEDDDGGRGSNARIRYEVQAGKRYIAKVRGLDSSDTGPYGFRAWLNIQVRLTPDEYEPDNDSNSAKQIEVGTSQQHTFHTSNDVDWVKFQITKPGRYVIRARGVNTNRLDTYIELFDSNMNPIDENDDGGDGADSLLRLHLENGLYYLKAECLDESPNQPYTISVMEE
jgi:hypothetical protein